MRIKFSRSRFILEEFYLKGFCVGKTSDVEVVFSKMLVKLLVMQVGRCCHIFIC